MAAKANILIIEADVDSAVAMAGALEKDGHVCKTVSSGQDGIERAQRDGYEVVVTGLGLQDMDGMEVLKHLAKSCPDTELVMVTDRGRHDTAVEAMQRGACAYISRPVNLQELRVIVGRATDVLATRQENRTLRRQLNIQYGLESLVGSSPQMVRVFEMIHQIAPTDALVLIHGESGTGKELVAKAIHSNSRRRNQRFVILNCAALSENLIESELFGHERGAFTGASTRRIGLFEHADHGSVFLDEIGDMPKTSQVKLLRVLESGEITRVGSNEPIQIDARVIAATHQDLQELVQEGRFREDLYYRLNVVSIRLAPLRERKEDISLLAESFVDVFRRAHAKEVLGIAPEVLNVLMRCPWPGNVRELKNCIEHMVVVTTDEMLGLDDLPEYLGSAEALPEPDAAQGRAELKTLNELEQEHIQRVLNSVDGNREKAAQLLGIGERTLYRKIERYGLR